MSGPKPYQQTNWDWRAASNFIFGGAGSGLAVWLAFASNSVSHPWLYMLAAIGLVGTGLTLVWTELGQPLRFMNVLRHPSSSWMTREAYAALILMGFGAFSVLLGHQLFYIGAGLFGFVFLYCQTRMLNACKGIPAWRVQTSVLLFVSTGLAEGTSLFLLISYFVPFTIHIPFVSEILQPIESAQSGIDVGGFVYILALVFIALRWAAWVSYRGSLLTNAPTMVVEGLNRYNLAILLGGHLLPLCLLALAVIEIDVPAFLPSAIIALASAIALLAGWFIKFCVVLLIAGNQGYSIPLTPERGPAGVVISDKPGWTSK